MRSTRESALAALLLAASCATAPSPRLVAVEDRPGEQRLVSLEGEPADRLERARIVMVDGVWCLTGRLCDPDRFTPPCRKLVASAIAADGTVVARREAELLLVPVLVAPRQRTMAAPFELELPDPRRFERVALVASDADR